MRRARRIGALSLATCMATAAAAAQPASSAGDILDRAVLSFEASRIEEAAAAFDDLAQRRPDMAPHLWQRGIALYYAARYDDCRRQFESHRTVNPNDVENAAWHFLCVARQRSPEAARETLLPVGPDPREPMREIYAMFRGTRVPSTVLAAAGPALRAQFYAHLYTGLYFEVVGDRDQARMHIMAAASDQYASVGGFMHVVARVHQDVRGWAASRR